MDYRNLWQVRPKDAAANTGDGIFDWPAMNNRKEALMSQGLPERAEITRLGQSFAVTAANAVAAVTALPTTAAHLSMNNIEPAGGKSYVIDAVTLIVTTASGAAGSTVIAACVNKGAQSAVATPDTVKINCLNGRASYNGNAKFKTGVTITDDGWFVAGGDMAGNSGTTAVGSGMIVWLNGGIIVPPQGIVSFAQLAVNATQAGKLGVIWHEVQLPMVG